MNKIMRVLVADDEPAMRRAICASLTAGGYAVDEVKTGEEAVAVAREQASDVILLDVNMPGMGGIEACRRIRGALPAVGIVMITVRDSEDDTVHAFQAGADDYITKPFRVREMLARIDALMRRARGEETPAPPSIIRAGRLELDLRHHTLRKSGEEVHLSPIEFSLIRYLMENPDVALEHNRLLRAIWGPEYGHELEYLRTYVRMLRRKIEEDPARPEYILTEPWLGYRFRVPAPALSA